MFLYGGETCSLVSCLLLMALEVEFRLFHSL
jgi:hypothetical protein